MAAAQRGMCRPRRAEMCWEQPTVRLDPGGWNLGGFFFFFGKDQSRQNWRGRVGRAPTVLALVGLVKVSVAFYQDLCLFHEMEVQ